MLAAIIIIGSLAVIALAVKRIIDAQTVINLNEDLFGSLPSWYLFRIFKTILTFVVAIPKFTLPPAIRLFKMCFAHHSSHMIALVCKYNIADHLALKELSVEELGSKEDLHADTLYRVLKYLETEGIFEEVPSKPRVFRNTKMSSHLMEKHITSIKCLAITQLFEIKRFGIMEEVLKKGKSETYTQVLNEQDDFERQNYELLFETASRMAMKPILGDFNFGAYRNMLDVGGNTGYVLDTILEQYPNMTGVVFDRPIVIDDSKRDSERNTRKNKSRMSFIGGDFFEKIPSVDPLTQEPIQLYFLKQILHDWSDEDCVRILKNIRQAINKDSILVISEPSLHEGHDPMNRQMDVLMASIGGRERTTRQFEELFQKSKFRLEKIVPLRSSHFLTIAKPI
jgi:Fe2+ or Zn2+ uptake regulation protein